MIFQKLGSFSRIQREGDQFLRIFRATNGIANPQALAPAGSPYATVYAYGYRELQSQVGAGSGYPNPGGKLKSLQAVTVNMQLAAAEEVRRAEKGMSWLATTGSVSPVHRSVRHRLGHHRRFLWTRRRRFRQPPRRRARHLRSALHHRRGLGHRHPCRYLLQPISKQHPHSLAQRLDTFTLESCSIN